MVSAVAADEAHAPAILVSELVVPEVTSVSSTRHSIHEQADAAAEQKYNACRAKCRPRGDHFRKSRGGTATESESRMTRCLRNTVRSIRILSALIAMVPTVVVVTDTVVAETMSDCINARIDHRKGVRTELDREAAACSGNRQCVKDVQAKWSAAAKQIDDEASACKGRVQSQTKAEPPPYLNWKPGDPSPQAKDRRRYIMSCSGKVLGMYQPGGAVEMELKTHPGNCFPNDSPWLLPGSGAPGTSVTNHCYELGTGSYKEYSGGRPSWCDPNR